MLLVGLALMGAAQAALQLSRFAAAEVHGAAERGRAVAMVVLGGTVGSIVGPLSAGPMGQVARGRGLDELAGPYGVSLSLFALAALVVWLFLRPDPRDLGRAIAACMSEAEPPAGRARPVCAILRRPAAVVAVAAMAFGQVAMVMLMGITALHMEEHHHPLSSVSVVISAHTVGMFAFSLVSGRLVDQFGRGTVIAMGRWPSLSPA